MKGINVFNILGKPVLTSRQSARRIKPVLSRQAHCGESPLCIDFSGTHGVSPSFIDETIRVAEECISDSGQNDTAVVFAHPPASLSSSHHAIARAHGRTLVVTENGDWEFRKN